MYIKIQRDKIEKIQIVRTNCTMTLKQVVAQYKPTYVINGGLYDMKTGKVNAIPLRINGHTVANSTDGYWMLAWNTGSDIKMIHSKDIAQYKYAVACSSMLKDGNNTIFKYTTAQGGIRGRTGFGCDKDNVHLFVTIDKHDALTPLSLRSRMKANGALDAIMLDSGGSSCLYYDGQYLQGEDRKVAYWICIWEKKPEPPVIPKPTKIELKCPYAEPKQLVRVGSSGNDAFWVQWYLHHSTSPTLPVDGTFYIKTRAAVIDFQKRYGLAADGIVGPATRAKLKEVAK